MDERIERQLLTCPAQGIYPDALMAEYLGWDAVSSGLLKDILERSVSYAEAVRRVVSRDTPSTMRGTAVHAAILEPEDFELRYGALSVGHNGSTTAGKDEIKVLAAQGKKALKWEVWEACVRLRAAAWKHDVLRPLLETCEAEVSAVCDTAHEGIRGKARADVLNRGAETILDLKTTTSADSWEFGKAAVDFGYHLSAPWYLDTFAAAGVPCRYWLAGALEVDHDHGHYAVAVYAIDEQVVLVARDRMRRALDRWALSRHEDAPPAYPPGVLPLRLPAWAFKETPA